MFVNWNEIMAIAKGSLLSGEEEGGTSGVEGTPSPYPPSPMALSVPKLGRSGTYLGSGSGSKALGLSADHVSRWEGLPLTAGGDSGAEDGEGPSLLTDTFKDDDDSKASEPLWKSPIKLVKILIPHIILISLLLSYLTIGAVILQRLETGTELQYRYEKFKRINVLYEKMVATTWESRRDTEMSRDAWRTLIRNGIMDISEAHEERSIRYEFTEPRNMTSRWTFPTSLLYVLTVLTTCGYGEVDVNTNGGKIFAVAFALVGIPLMFITAADIGKFLSETLMKGVGAAERCWRHLLWCCCRRRPKGRGGEHRGSRGGGRDLLDDMVEGGEPELGDSLLFPIGAYVSLICLYCSLGAILFCSYQEGWSFIHAFHFGFNLIVTVGLGRMVCSDIFYLCMIVAYVIIGLSVVTMCVDLASTHLKAYFTKIHYFGQARSRFLGMNEDIREMVQLFAAMRGKKGGKVTWNEFKQFLETEEGRGQAAFCPKDYAKLRWVDETSSQISTLRHNSVTSELIPSDHPLRRQHSHSSSRKGKRKEPRPVERQETLEEEDEDKPPPPPPSSSQLHRHAGLL